MDNNMGKEAFVTLATDDVYSRGACVLANSLRAHDTKKDLVVMITPQVSDKARSMLKALFDEVVEVDILDSNDATHLAMLKRPELGVTFTKLHCWTLTKYRKCVFMDADTMALVNIDELFDYNELSAAPDAGWPDLFNSGLFVFVPSMDTYNDLIVFAEEKGSFDGGDQGLLNSFFSDWLTGDIRKHLSFLYNMHTNATYTYCPAFARFGDNTKVVHFIGAIKPWHHMYDRTTGTLYQVDSKDIHEEKFIREWWSYDCMTQDQLNNMSSLSNNACKDVYIRHWRWKTDQIDYLGRDKFENLQKKMDVALSEAAPSNTKVRTIMKKTILKSADSPSGGKVETSSLPSVPSIKKRSSSGDGSSVESFEKWKRGEVDFLGSDKFDNIQAKLDETLMTPSTTKD